jgi:hypothetical protein
MRLNYDRVSPITGKMTVLDEFDELTNTVMSLDMETGYQTYDDWIEGGEAIERFEETSPDIVLETRFVESKSRQVWYKTTLFSRGIVLYPDGKKWKVSQFKPAGDNPTPAFTWATMKIGEDVFVMDDTNAIEFGEFEFEDAFFKFHELNSTIYDTNPN